MKTPRLLKPDEISCRVQQVTESGGAIILLYKDARVDMNILDETYGAMNWKREHQTIDGNLYCTISVWDEAKGQWVSKQDVGVESYTEATKGEASDSFKRAGFNWGIGRELYTAPFVFVQLNDDEWRERNGRKQTTFKFGLTVKEIEYNEAREITRLLLVDKGGKVRFKHEGKEFPLPPAEVEETPLKRQTKRPAQVTVIQPHEIKARNEELKALLKDRKKTMEDYKAIAGARSVATMTQGEYDKFLSELIEAWS
jgi:hypothetical protein